MIKKHHYTLTAILVAQLALSVVAFWPRPSVAGEQEPLFPDLETEDVTRLTIEGEEGSAIALARVAGNWVLPEADDYPAQADAVNTLLEKLIALSTGRLVASSQTSHKRLQVSRDAFARQITMETSDGTQTTLYIGSSPQYGAVHFRLEGENETYLTSELTSWDADTAARAWIDTTYQSVAQDDVTRLTLENASGRFVFEREDEETWALVEPADLEEGESLKQTQIGSLLRRAASISMREPLGKDERVAYGMDEPEAVVTLETDGETVTLYVGAKDEDGSYVVKSSQSDYYVRVASSGVSALVENDREALVQEPTPPAESDDS